MGLVEQISGLNRHRFRGDPEVLVAWDSARNVLGPARSQATQPPQEPDPPPSTPPGEKVA